MSRSIDNRIVEMQFDNRNFESNVKTSVDSLKNLKKSLDLSGAAKNLGDLSAASRNFGMSGMAESVQAISDKFSALGIIGITALQNITNSAINTGKRILSALTIEPLRTGLSEYETKLNAIQTILTNTESKGTTLEDVNKALADLNEYSDKTIYNFAEMARNIGTFTAAGIDLDTSVSAIKGIANLAAGSGSNAQQAATAMYQLSQALAAGSLKLQDWNSVVNAGMGGELFQNALKKTAKQMGIFVDESVPFRESLKDGWITSEVLTRTLGEFAENESLVKAATQVKTFTQLYDTMKESVQSGWAVSWEQIIGDKDQAAETLTKINDAFGEIVGSSAEARNEMLRFWNQNGGRDALIEGLTNVLKGLAAVMKPVSEAFREVFPPMTGEKLVALTKGFRDLTERFKIGEETADKLKITFKGLFSILSIIGQVISTVVKGILALTGVVVPAGVGILDVTSAIGAFLVNLKDAVDKTNVFTNALDRFKNILRELPKSLTGSEKIAEFFSTLAKNIGKAFGSVQEHVVKALGEADYERIFGALNSGIFAAILLGLRTFIKSLTNVVDQGGNFLGGITGILDGVRGSLEAYQQQLKAGTLLKIATAIGILSAALYVLSTIDPQKLESALGAMTVLFVELIGSMAVFEKFVGGMRFKAMLTTTATLMALSTAMLLLAFAVKTLSKLDWDELGRGLAGVAGMSAILVGSSKALSTSSGRLAKSSMGFILFATALLILTVAVKRLADLDTGDMVKGLLGIGVLVTGLVIFMKTADMGGMGIRTGLGILFLANALVVMAKAVKIFSEIDTNALIKGLIGLGIVLAQIAIFVNLTGGAKGIISTAIGLTIMATAMVIFTKAIENIGGMSLVDLAKGLGGLAASLIIMGVAMHAMKTGLPGAAAMLVMAAAIALLVPSLMLLGSMSLSEIGKGILAMAGMFVVLGAAALILGPLVPVILALSAAVALFGVACLAVGAGVLLLSMGLTAIAISGVAAASGLVAIVMSIASTIPILVEKFGEGLVALAKLIGEKAPIFAESIFKLILAILDTIKKYMPDILQRGIEIVLALTKGITESLPKLIQAGFELIIAFIDGLAEALRKNTDKLINAFTKLMSAVIDAGKKALIASVKGFNNIGRDIVNGLMNGIKSKLKSLAKVGTDIGRTVLGSAKSFLGIKSPSRAFGEVGKYSAMGFVDGIKKFGGKVAQASKDMGATSIKSLRNAVSDIADAITGDVQPTIRPVVDMTDVNKGIETAFSKKHGIDVSSIKARTAKISGIGGSSVDGASGDIQTNNATSVHITNHYNVRNDSDIRRISQDMKNIMLRYTNAKGVPVTS